jgi:hypothetical protein
MQTLRAGVVRRLGVVALAAILLVPVTLGGHQHADHASAARPCAICVVAHHAPLLGAPVVAVAAPVLLRVATMPPVRLATTRAHRPTKIGRAPPLASPTRAA